jgi:hypothetical protein
MSCFILRRWPPRSLDSISGLDSAKDRTAGNVLPQAEAHGNRRTWIRFPRSGGDKEKPLVRSPEAIRLGGRAQEAAARRRKRDGVLPRNSESVPSDPGFARLSHPAAWSEGSPGSSPTPPSSRRSDEPPVVGERLGPRFLRLKAEVTSFSFGWFRPRPEAIPNRCDRDNALRKPAESRCLIWGSRCRCGLGKGSAPSKSLRLIDPGIE